MKHENRCPCCAKTRALFTEVQSLREQIVRLRDLVRYCRHHLHEENLITDEEFSDLLTNTPDSVERLESYDRIRKRYEEREESVRFHAQRASEFEERIAELERDERRLDWLIHQPAYVAYSQDGDDCWLHWCWDKNDEERGAFNQEGLFTDPREALDAALSTEQSKDAANAAVLCSDCPPEGYPTDKTRCIECPRAAWNGTEQSKEPKG